MRTDSTGDAMSEYDEGLHRAFSYLPRVDLQPQERVFEGTL